MAEQKGTGVFDSLPIGALYLDLKLEITWASKRFSHLFNCESDELIGDNFEALISPKDSKGESRFYSKLVQYQSGILDTQLSLRIAGKDYFTRIRMSKEEERWTVYVEDILTEPNLTFQLLWEEEKFSNIVKFSGEGIAILDESNRILEFNRKFFDFMNFKSEHNIALSEAALSGKNIFELLGDSFHGLIDTLEDSKGSTDSRYTEIYTYGDYIFQVQSNPTILPIKGFTGNCLVFKDITAQKKLEVLTQELNQSNEILDQLNQEKNYLMNVVAHDLKSPLNQIAGLMNLIKLEEDRLSEQQMDCCEKILDSSTRLSSLINTILDQESIDNQKLNLTPEQLHVDEVLKQLVDNFQTLANEKDIDLGFEIHNAPLTTTLDRNFTIQVFENLISNAIKFSPPEKSVQITARLENEDIVTEIKDNGPGLTEDDKNKLFKKFSKLSAKPTGKETSSGLGLSIVKKYVDAMNGKVWCESKSGFGAKFVVSFPKS